MPFRNNRILLHACKNLRPVVLRDFHVMRAKINFLLPNLADSIEMCAELASTIAIGHKDDCDACVLLKNIQFRFKHDMDLFRAYLENATLLWSGIAKSDSINSASSSDFLSLALTTRALLDNVFRSCILFLECDIRIYNKYLADSLTGLRKLRWSSFSQEQSDEELENVLKSFDSLSSKQRNDSALFADPAPTFKRKSEYLGNRDISFIPFLDETTDLYSALSDIVHAGAASIAANAPSGPQIVLGDSEIRYIASAHHLAELIGITLASAHGWLIRLYMPGLTVALSHVEGTDNTRGKLERLQSILRSRVEGLQF